MTQLRVLHILGTRPEAIKLAPVILGMRERANAFEPILCTTGQHREMLGSALSAFGLEADLPLDVMKKNQSLAGLTATLIADIDKTMEEAHPDIVMVQGDTTSAFAGALCAFYRGLPAVHVEAGLRTRDLRSPFPEEGNRQIIGRLASLHFAPTERNRVALIEEGISPDCIEVTGNTGIDALLMMSQQTCGTPVIPPTESTRPIALITLHRRESFGATMNAILGELARAAAAHPEWDFLFPVHLNPNIAAPAHAAFAGARNVDLCPPMDYPRFVRAMSVASLILTDSGGIQEEAPSLHKPVLVLRDLTERQEAVDAGTVILAGTSPDAIRILLEPLLADPDRCRNWPHRPNPYGDGQATCRILDALQRRFPGSDS